MADDNKGTQQNQEGGQQTNTQQGNDQQEGNQNSGGAVEIDYDKIAQIVLGKQNKTEDGVVKGILKQQGLSDSDLDAAIKMYKEHKAKNTPNVEQLNTTIAGLKKENRTTKLESLATLAAIKMGVETNTIPYLLKCIDFPNTEEIKTEDIDKAVKKVLDDVPQFKSSKEDGKGFKSFGGKDSGKGGNANEDDALKKAFGIG